jgi:hypothetical protein
MTYVIKLNGVEVARVAGERIQFGRKMASSSLLERNTVDDTAVLRQLDAEGKTIWVMLLSHRGQITVEEIPCLT